MTDIQIISWLQAKKNGMTRYFTGKPCPRGHVAHRMVSSRVCVKCNSGRIRKRKPQIDRTKPRERSRRWYYNHLEVARAKQRASASNRKATKKARGGKHTAADIEAIFTAQKGKCAYCREHLTRKRHVDHIIALSCGGSNDRTNLQLTCVRCNLSKSTKDPIDYARSLGRLL